MSTSAHRNKRPFQPSITSYFARVDPSDLDASPSPNRDTAPHHGGLAAVPANVQASLLNVGMRVRKSVPEGYKTQKTLGPAPNAPSYYKPAPTTTFGSGPAAAARPTELLPFCGLHKTGGYDVQQPLPTATAIAPYPYNAGDSSLPVDAHALAFAADDLGLSSQESNASTLSTNSLPHPVAAAAANAQKRRFEEEEEDGSAGGSARPLFPSLNTSLAVPAPRDDDPQISPRTVYPVSHTAMPNLDAPMRPVARPKSRMKNGVSAGIGGADRRLAVDEEGLDFGEADFLRPVEDDGDAEMEMGVV